MKLKRSRNAIYFVHDDKQFTFAFNNFLGQNYVAKSKQLIPKNGRRLNELIRQTGKKNEKKKTLLNVNIMLVFA